MALIEVSNSLIQNIEMFDLLMDSFENTEVIKNDEWRGVTTFRVQHEEVTKEDKIICPSFYRFEGVRPFIIKYDL